MDLPNLNQQETDKFLLFFPSTEIYDKIIILLSSRFKESVYIQHFL